MNFLKQLWGSSLGKKYVMAVTGCFLFLFLIGHLLGNLQLFLGPEALNAYAYFLHSKPGMVWAARLGLLVVVGLHVTAAVRLTMENRAARPVPYAGGVAPVAASYASRTMFMSGLIIAAFVLYHLLHFTVQVEAVNLVAEGALKDFRSLQDAQGRADVFRMVVIGFNQPLVAGFYVLAVGLLCLHLSHGLSAMVQSLGGRGCCPAAIDWAARAVSALIFAGYVSIPIAVLLGYGKGVLQ